MYTCVDDVVEDVSKLAALYASFRVGSRLGGRLAGVAAVVLLYEVCDTVADKFGDVMEVVRNYVFAWLGLAPPPEELQGSSTAATWLARTVDDMTEDSLKLLCLFTHLKAGGMFATGALDSTLGLLGMEGTRFMPSPSLRAAVQISLSIASAASKYGHCDKFADAAGNLVQSLFVI